MQKSKQKTLKSAGVRRSRTKGDRRRAKRVDWHGKSSLNTLYL